MKKRLLAMLLSALLVMNISACVYLPEKEIESKTNAESTESDTSNAPNDTENAVEDIETTEDATSQNAPPKAETWYSIACNGVYRNSKVQYAIDQNKQLILYIEDWDETFVVPKEDMYFDGVNIGYEIHGNYDCTVEFKNFNMVAYNK